MGNRYGDVQKALTGDLPFTWTDNELEPSTVPTAASEPSAGVSGGLTVASDPAQLAGKKRKKTEVVSTGPVIDLTDED